MDLDFMLEHLPRLLKATKLTIQLTLLSLFLVFLLVYSLQYLEQVKIKFFTFFHIIIHTFLEVLLC